MLVPHLCFNIHKPPGFVCEHLILSLRINRCNRRRFSGALILRHLKGNRAPCCLRESPRRLFHCRASFIICRCIALCALCRAVCSHRQTKRTSFYSHWYVLLIIKANLCRQLLSVEALQSQKSWWIIALAQKSTLLSGFNLLFFSCKETVATTKRLQPFLCWGF